MCGPEISGGVGGVGAQNSPSLAMVSAVPPDLWRVVLGFMSGVDRVRVGRVCKQWRAWAPVIAGPVTFNANRAYVPLFTVSVQSGDGLFKPDKKLHICGLWSPARLRWDYGVHIPSGRPCAFIGFVGETERGFEWLEDSVRQREAAYARFLEHMEVVNRRSIDLTGVCMIMVPRSE
jgi:hypothetical protein